MLRLPFVVFSVANCITFRTGCFISRSCQAWSEKKSSIFCRRQRHQRRDPQANIQPSGMCYKKGSATSTIWTEHFALYPHGKPVSRAYPMAAVFQNHQNPPPMATVFYRGFYRKIENLRLQCAWSGEVTGKNSNKVFEKREWRPGSVPNYKARTLAVWKLKGKKLWNWTQRNGQFYVQLCTENQCNRATLMVFYTNLTTEFFYTGLIRRSVLNTLPRRLTDVRSRSARGTSAVDGTVDSNVTTQGTVSTLRRSTLGKLHWQTSEIEWFWRTMT